MTGPTRRQAQRPVVVPPPSGVSAPSGTRSEAQPRDMNSGTPRPDDAERLRQFKADFFKALSHPLRIWILELLRSGPMSVTQIQAATDVPGSSVSQQLAVLRGRNILTTER